MRTFTSPTKKLATTLLLCACLAVPAAMAQPAASPVVVGTWSTVQNDHGARTLSFKGTANLMGKPVPVELQFFCSYENTKMLHGAIGFDMRVNGVEKLAPFSFDDFEGPDAPTIGKSLMQIAINRTGQTALTYQASPSGSYVENGVFMFEVSEMTQKPSSIAKSVVKALADDKAESLHIVITDPKDAKRTLDLTISMADKRGDFKALLSK